MPESPSDSLALRRIEPQLLLQAAIEKGASVETLERLLALAKDVRAEQAKEAYNEAMEQFQNTVPVVRKNATAKVLNFEYIYATLDHITAVIMPVMAPLGLSISYRIGHAKDSVTANCRISHRLGHFEESGAVEMPVDVGGKSAATPAQRVGIAVSYAKRYALLAITGITPQGEDVDADTKVMGEKTGGVETEQPVKDGVGQVTAKLLKVEKKKTAKGAPIGWVYLEGHGTPLSTFDQELIEKLEMSQGRIVILDYSVGSGGEKSYRHITDFSLSVSGGENATTESTVCNEGR